MNDASRDAPIAIIGCGYVGQALGAALVRAGHRVVATTTTPARLAELASADLAARLLDVADADALRAVLAVCRAVYLTLAGGRGADYRAVYLAGARNLMRVLPTTPVTRVIYTSSTRVYHQDDGSWVTESSPTVADSPNAAALLDTERTLLEGPACGSATRRVCVSVVRLGGIYGPGRELERVALRAAGTTREDGDTYVNLVHRDDIVAALVKLLNAGHHGVLNLVDDEPTTRRALYDPLLSAAGALPVHWIARQDKPALGKRVANRALKQLLHLKLAHPTHCTL